MVQDHPTEAPFVEEALTMHDVPFQLIAFQDGAQALDYLELLRITGMETCPDVLLLDLNLMSVDSREILESFRKTAGNERATLIVTSSTENCSTAEATRWFRQPFGFLEYMEIGRLAKDLYASMTP
jgi:DNA-binding response OmpR family regulator